MTGHATHLRDDELLLCSSRELPVRANDTIAAHLDSCAVCKARLRHLEGSLEEISELQRLALNAELPSAAGPRALLKAQLASFSAEPRSVRKRLSGAAWLLTWRPSMVLASVALIAGILATRAWRRIETPDLALVLAEKPDVRFTPGAVVATTQSRVCVDSTDAPAAIPAAMKTRVLQLYGVEAGQSDAYEVDYLITPELGGATDIHNLWPEPYDHTTWNAHVKDQLEDRLRDLVCHGDLDLATAQHDISVDWIAAYRKYFQVDKPVQPDAFKRHVQS